MNKIIWLTGESGSGKTSLAIPLAKELNAIVLDFLKIDVEYAEPQVIEGAKRIIEENKDIKIVIEVTPTKIKKPIEYIKMFIKLGFSIYDCDRKLKEIKTEEEIQEFLELYKTKTTNLFLIRGGKNV